MATFTEPPRGNVAGIVLAAGLSTRMGSLKQLLPVAGKPMVARVAEVLVTAGLADVVVVVGHKHDTVEAALTDMPVRAVFNPDYASGEMFSSVQTGLWALAANTGAALIALGDQPLIAPQTVRALVVAYARGPAAIYQPQFGNRRGHPILLGRTVWPEVLAAAQGTTLRDIVRQHAAERRFVPVDDPQILADLNRPKDLSSLPNRSRKPHTTEPSAH